MKVLTTGQGSRLGNAPHLGVPAFVLLEREELSTQSADLFLPGLAIHHQGASATRSRTVALPTLFHLTDLLCRNEIVIRVKRGLLEEGFSHSQ